MIPVTKADGTTESLTTRYVYDPVGRLIKTTNPDGTFTQTAYNSIGKQISLTDARGNVTQYAYSPNGFLLSVTYPDNLVETYRYDAEGHRLSDVNPLGFSTTTNYDALYRVTNTVTADGAMVSTVYDALGRVKSTTDQLRNITTYAYDDAGRRTSVTDPLGHVTSFVYDAAGNQTSVTDANGNVTQFVYDDAGRRIQTIFADLSTESVAYDALGRQASKTDQAGKITRFGYDTLGRLVTVTDALGQITSYGYDELGNRITQTDASGRVTKFTYDQLGRRSQRILPLGQVERYSYDVGGNLASRTDFNGHTTSYSYDNRNRLTAKAADPFFSQGACAGGACGATRFSYTYTATGRRASMTDDLLGQTTYSYDRLERLLAKNSPIEVVQYAYDLAGNLTGLTRQGSAGVSYTYDAANRLASVAEPAGTTTYSYDPAGNLTGFTYPNDVATSYAYNPLNRLTQMQSTCGAQTGCGTSGTPVARYSYTLGAAGNRLSVAELSGRNVSYGYDDLYRLTSETVAGAATQNGAISYQYDAVGNRKQLTSTVAAIPSGLINYDANDRVSTDVYDNNGNTLNNGGIGNVYDFENRLVQHGAVKIVYDGDGNRVSETVGGVTTNYVVADVNPTGYSQVILELQNGFTKRAYTYGLERISQTLASGGQALSFYGYDGHGSVRYLTGSTGAVTDTYDYDAFGNLIASTGTTPNNYLFAGEQFDPALGVYYNRARYYDQRQGRFWTADTYEGHQQDPTSLHRYLFSNADPVDLGDPSGLLTDYSPYGYVIEPRIQAQYVVDYPGNDYLFGEQARLGKNLLLKPDIFDRTRRIWMDIKPLSFTGITAASATLSLYNTNFSPLGYVPDTSWEPTYQNPIGYGGKLFFIKNIEGILFYTVDTDNRRLKNVQTLAGARQLLRDLQRQETIGKFLAGASIFAVGAGAAIGALINATTATTIVIIKQDVAIAVLEDAA